MNAMDWVNATPSVWWNVCARPVESPALGVVIRECIAAKRAANRRAVYVYQLERMLGRFALGREKIPIASIGVPDLESFLSTVTLASRNGVISRLGTLFSYAEKRGHIDRNPVRRLDRASIDHAAPRILTPPEADRLLRLALSKDILLLGYLVIGLFAGIRPAELDRMGWDSVDMARAIVRVDASASKVRRRRIVPLEEAALRWLAVVPKMEGKIAPPAKQRRLQLLAARLGFDCWHHDLLRHSCASFWLAKYQDAGKVAHWLGNSPGILYRHYAELVTPEDAIAFWSLAPPST